MDIVNHTIDIETGEKQQTALPIERACRSKTAKQRKMLADLIVYGIHNARWFASDLPIHENTLELIVNFAQGTKDDIDYLVRLLRYAKQFGNNYEIIVVSLVILSASSREYAKRAFSSLFNEILEVRENMSIEYLSHFLQIIKMRVFRGFGKLIQRALINWLDENLTSENVIHWRSRARITYARNSQPINSFTISDIIKLAHYHSADTKKQELTEFILFLSDLGRGTTTQDKNILIYKEFASGTILQRNKIALSGTLPFEIIIENTSSKKLWDAGLKCASYRELILNLNNFNRAGIFATKANVQYAENYLIDEDQIRESKFTPFHFMAIMNAYNAGINDPIKKALNKALEISYINLPKFKKRVAIFLDNSPIANRLSSLVDIELSTRTIINTLGAIFYKHSKNVILIPFSDKATLTAPRRALSTSAIAKKITSGLYNTPVAFAKPIKLLMRDELDVDYIIGITNGASWLEILRTNVGDSYTKYFNSIGKNASVLLWRLDDNISAHIEHPLNQVTFLDGHNYKVISFLLDHLSNNINEYYKII